MATAKKRASKKRASGKKTSSSKAVGRARAQLPANWKDQLRKDAAEEADRTPAGAGNKIVLNNNGTFTFQGASLGEHIDVIIVDHCAYHAYFDRPYDEDNPTPPACFALKMDPRNIAPHAEAPDPQSEVCEGCWANEFGSDNREKGKACHQKHRLAILHGEATDGDLVLLEVPPKSGPNFRTYLKSLNKGAQIPSYAALTRVTMDENYDYPVLLFELIDDLSSNEDAMAEIIARRAIASDLVMTIPDVSGYEAPKRKGRPAGGSKKKASKKKTRRSRVS